MEGRGWNIVEAPIHARPFNLFIYSSGGIALRQSGHGLPYFVLFRGARVPRRGEQEDEGEEKEGKVSLLRGTRDTPRVDVPRLLFRG